MTEQAPDPQSLDPAEEPDGLASHLADLDDVDDATLNAALDALDPADLVQGDDHPYDPALDPEAVPPWERP